MRDDDLPLLSGTVPGLLDPSQPSRLLRTPTSSLFFATFDPLAARASKFPDLASPHIEPEAKAPERVKSTNSNGKRIVVEIDPENGTCSWRFVPRAKVDVALSGSEGPWPRIVEICGQLVRMTQDQWDLYKLDPEYDCVVYAPPSRTKVTRKIPNANFFDSDDASASNLPDTPKRKAASKDPFTTPKPKQHTASAFSDHDSPLKRRKLRSSFTSDTEMAINEDPSYTPLSSTDEANGQGDGNRMKRRWAPDRSSEGDAPNTEKPKPPKHKDTGSFVFGNLSSNGAGGGNNVLNTETPAKKVRTRSPDTVRQELEQKRIYREKRRKTCIKTRLDLRRDGLQRAFWNKLGVPPTLHDPGLYEDLNRLDISEKSETLEDEIAHEIPASSESTTEADTEAQRLAKIEESRRKLAELEKDKPLWEESARKRQAREREEEQMRQRAKAIKEEEERQRRQARAARRKFDERQEQERQECERERRKQAQSGRMFVRGSQDLLWSVGHALRRYLEMSTRFDAAKFSDGTNSATFSVIPWPMLRPSFSVQEIEWDAIEKFFGKAEALVTPAEFKDLVEKSHRRFHPDRWRSRGLLVSVKDDMERDLLEVAGSTVAQAITPLWRKVTGRST